MGDNHVLFVNAVSGCLNFFVERVQNRVGFLFDDDFK